MFNEIQGQTPSGKFKKCLNKPHDDLSVCGNGVGGVDGHVSREDAAGGASTGVLRPRRVCGRGVTQTDGLSRGPAGRRGEESRLELSDEVISIPQISATLIPISVHLLAGSPAFKLQPYNTPGDLG